MDKKLNLIGGIGLGVALMYYFDPDCGEHRRKLLADRMRSLMSGSGAVLDKTSGELRNRTRGLVAETRARLSRDTPDDVVLVERVRSAMGRVVSHPRRIEVAAESGRVTLRGQIPAHEVDNLLATVYSVRGVRNTDNQLQVHQQAADVLGLPDATARLG